MTSSFFTRLKSAFAAFKNPVLHVQSISDLPALRDIPARQNSLEQFLETRRITDNSALQKKLKKITPKILAALAQGKVFPGDELYSSEEPCLAGLEEVLKESFKARGWRLFFASRYREGYCIQIHPFGPKKILLTAPPRTGKSTAVKETVQILRQRGLHLAGFFTEAVLDQAGARLGFDLVDVNGRQRATLCRVGYKSSVLVGRYGVDLEALNKFLSVLEVELNDAGHLDLVVIDEIGGMQLAAPQFASLVKSTLDKPIGFIGTVGVLALPATNGFQQRSDVDVMTLTNGNRDDMPSRLACNF